MASSDVDQKYLGRIADMLHEENQVVSKSLFQILGLSVLLARKLYRARRLRKLDISRDTKSLQLYHHIIWLSREGLSLLEILVLPSTIDGSLGPECQVLTAKLRASFCHIFCLFHNNPPVSQASGPNQGSTPAPLSPRHDNGQRRDRRSNGSSLPRESMGSSKRNSRGRASTLRDPIASITSEASFLTNPFEGLAPGTMPSPENLVSRFGLQPMTMPHPSAFLLPPIDFKPLTQIHFKTAMDMATALPGAHPLRLSVAIEYSAFLWDCMHDHEASRQLARRAIRELRHAEEEGVTDEMFEDAAEQVGLLGRTMRRRSWESTPPKGQNQGLPKDPVTPTVTRAPTNPALLYSTPPTPAPVGPLPAVPPAKSPAAKGTQPTTPRRVKVYRDEDSNAPDVSQVDGPNISPTANTSASRRTSKTASTPATQRVHQRDRSSGTGKSVISVQTPGSYQIFPVVERSESRGSAQETPRPAPPPKDTSASRPTTATRRTQPEISPASSGSKPGSRSGLSAKERLEVEREKERAKASRQYEERTRQSNETSRTPNDPRPSTSTGRPSTSTGKTSGHSRVGSSARPSTDSRGNTITPATNPPRRTQGNTTTTPKRNDAGSNTYPVTGPTPTAGNLTYDDPDRGYGSDGAVANNLGGVPVGSYVRDSNGRVQASNKLIMAGQGQRRVSKPAKERDKSD